MVHCIRRCVPCTWELLWYEGRADGGSSKTAVPLLLPEPAAGNAAVSGPATLAEVLPLGAALPCSDGHVPGYHVIRHLNGQKMTF